MTRAGGPRGSTPRWSWCTSRPRSVYLPDELAEAARAAGLNVSNVAQEALRRELAGQKTSAWLDQVRRLPATGVSHDEALAAIDDERDEVGDRFG